MNNILFCAGSRASETGSELSQSVSSLDRDDSIIAAEPLRKVSVDRVPEERETPSAEVAPVVIPTHPQPATQPPTTTVATANPQTLSRVAAPNADSQALVSPRQKSTPEKVSSRSFPIRNAPSCPSSPKQVLDIVRAAESLALGGNLIENGPPKSPTEPPTAETLQKTTTIVMSKHTLDTQAPQVSVRFSNSKHTATYMSIRFGDPNVGLVLHTYPRAHIHTLRKLNCVCVSFVVITLKLHFAGNCFVPNVDFVRHVVICFSRFAFDNCLYFFCFY